MPRICRARWSPLLLALALVAAGLSGRGVGVRPAAAAGEAQPGMWLATADGGVLSSGQTTALGSLVGIKLSQPVVGMAATPSGRGYWLVASDGGIFSYGDARFYGSTGAIKLNKPIVGMASTPTGNGYWLVASDGGIFSYGDARFYGSTGAITLNKPIVGMASTPTGNGYWLVATDGGIFSYGDARFYGSTGAITLNKPIVGMASTPTGNGYWLVASDGGIFSYGDARFYGSAARPGAEDVARLVATPSGKGYWAVSRTGAILAMGDATPLTGPARLSQPVVGAALVPTPSPTGPAEVPAAPEPADPGPAPGPALLTPAQKGRPNILLIVMDDQRADHTLDVMPRTREWLQAGGTTFENGYANTPLCCPERATIFSGRAMHNHGIFRNGEGTKLDQTWTLGRYLHDAGYQTGIAGKFLVGWNEDKAPPHYDQWAIMGGGYEGAHINVNGDTRTVDYSTDALAEISTEFLDKFEEQDGQPWYLHVTPQAPHDSTDGNFYWPERHDNVAIPKWEPSPAVLDTDKDDQHSYVRDKDQSMAESERYHDGGLRTLLAADEMVDAVLRKVEAAGELDNTLVIFTSDNGFSWGERGVGSKGLPYVESVKVPFLVRWPGVMAAGATDPRPVGGVDLLPSLLDAASYSPPVLGYTLDGRSLFNPAARERILLEMHEGHRGIPDWASLRSNAYQYIEYYESDTTTIDFREYYDLTSDPWQLNNLLEDGDPANDPDAAQLSADLAAARTCVGTTGPNSCP